ncbi:MAG TPA: methyltransferase [Saprospiraceae bacterium]|nr:methyltransferase [Saprospiraceae bacterium]
MSTLPGTYTYKDKNSGNSITVDTSADVFYPTSTTNILLSGVRTRVHQEVNTVLDLGCGCGVVAIALGKLILPHAQIYASDISEEAAQLTRRNAEHHQLSIDCRSGSLFEPWQGMRFDVIVDDVAGVSEPIARLSGWYPPQIHSDADEDGTRWIVKILEQAGAYLSPQGQFFFPVLTLSDETKILSTAQDHFANVELISTQWYPFGKELLAHMEVIEDLMNRGKIRVKKEGSRFLWATLVYLATNDGN